MWRFIFPAVFFISLPAQAQTQQGYAHEQPSILVDRSVLEELKGYQPPPMFGDNNSTQITPKVISPPEAPTLTAPKVETLLNHPVENFRVLTERNPQPQKTSPIANPISSSKSLHKSTPEKLEQKKVENKAKVLVKPDTPVKKEVPKQIKKESKEIKSTSSGYKPKASPTMPAVPPIHVDRDILPALPPTTADITSDIAATPSIGERMMDAALDRQIEKDNNKIIEKLASEKNNLKTPTLPHNKKAIQKTPNNSLEFESGQVNLTEKIQIQIQKLILPEITNDLNSRVQILSFATSSDKTENSAKRIALARALSVRDYLKKINIDTSRIDVRALMADGSLPPDRVDIILLK